MLQKVVSYEAGKLKFSYQEPSEFAKELEAQRVGTRKLSNVISEKLDGGIELAVALGDITTAQNVDAWVIPEFDHCVSEGGVAKSIMDRAQEIGLQQDVLDARKDYQTIVDNGTNFGYAHITTGLMNQLPKAFIHVVTAEVPRDVAHDIIAEATFNALETADRAGLKSIALPLLNTGMSASFSSTSESAKAMLEGINRFMQSRSGQQVTRKVVIVAYQKEASGKMMSVRQILDHSRAQAKTADKINTLAYGSSAQQALIQELYGQFWNMTRSKAADLTPEFTIAKKVVMDLLEDVGGIFFNLLSDEEALELKASITAKLLQAAKANPEVALSKEFLLSFIRSISELTIDENEFSAKLDEAIAQYKKDLDDQIRKLQTTITKVETTIQTQLEVLNRNSTKKVTADSPKFGKLNDQVAKAREFMEDCKKLKVCVERINRKVVDEAEFKSVQEKYNAAMREIDQLKRTSADEMNDVQSKLQRLKREYSQITDEKKQLELQLQQQSQRQAVSARSSRYSG